MLRRIVEAFFGLGSASLLQKGLSELTICDSQTLFVSGDTMELQGFVEISDGIVRQPDCGVLQRNIRV